MNRQQIRIPRETKAINMYMLNAIIAVRNVTNTHSTSDSNHSDVEMPNGKFVELFFYKEKVIYSMHILSYLDNQFNFRHITIGSPILLIIILGHCFCLKIVFFIQNSGRIE